MIYLTIAHLMLNITVLPHFSHEVHGVQVAHTICLGSQS